MSGNIKKDKQYRANLLENIGKDHPINKGFFMQIHHLISAKAVSLSKTGPFLVSSGYDINIINNLVALPSTLQGACHLEVQLHRGDHTQPIELDEDNYDDDDHPPKYHSFIKKKLIERVAILKKECGKGYDTLHKEVKTEMEVLSEDILHYISNFTVPLTSIHRSFKHDGEGCKNSLSVGKHKQALHPCELEGRNHNNSEHSYSKKADSVTIKFEKPKTPYRLKAGQ